ncbi:MAG: aspartate aminotransferase family protein [Sumerlaeia bacterium]
MTSLDALQLNLMPNYGNRDVLIRRGKGSRCWDSEGRVYLDFLGGIAVNNVGHAHPEVLEAVHAQVDELIHCSNVFLVQPQLNLAEKLTAATGLEKVFFANSGTEVTEAAIKLARRWALNTKGEGKFTILCLEGSFHGRTLGSMSATWSAKVRENFGPLPAGIRFVKLNDLESVDAAWGDDVCAVMMETVQGEGGVKPCSKAFLQGVEKRCKERSALLMIDEIQCGIGRTGYPFAYMWAGVNPDVVLCAKAIGGGLPLGALLAKARVAEHLQVGSHGSTFGGNPVSCAAGCAVLDIVFDEDFLAGVLKNGEFFWSELCKMQGEFLELIQEVRGPGLMIGVQLSCDGTKIPAIGRKHGILFNCTAVSTLRFLPPLTTPRELYVEALRMIRLSLKEFQESQP